jgi:glucosamine--fructose-6-phosphate aminotransferase (isomerizing)
VCGIVGISADPELHPNVTRALVEGLLRLEYRGYDSAGFALVECNSESLLILRDKGRISHVVEKYNVLGYCSRSGLAHTRWATHGEPSQRNAHPHTDCEGRVAVVHNGIIKNYLQLKRELEEKGHRFSSDTDTEVIAHLIEDYLRQGLTPWEAFRRAVSRLEGAFAIAVIVAEEPHRIYFARNVSPLIVGLGSGFNMVSSDIPSILPYTRRVIVLEDGELGYIEPAAVYIERGSKGVDWKSRVMVVSWSVEDAEKGGYPHFMLKEIMEQPRALRETFEGLLSDRSFEEAAEIIARASKVFITGAGTSYHAGLVFAYYLLRLAGIAAHAFIASEYDVYEGSDLSDSVLVAISQSGETIDTLQALRAFKREGATVIAVSNILGSTIPRESNIAVYTRAGPEIGVAATKTYLTQVLTLTSIALAAGRVRGKLTRQEYLSLLSEISEAPKIAARSIDATSPIIDVVSRPLSKAKSVYILGRGLGALLAYEGALKVKEVSYIHAEAYPAGESKHGPIALVERGFPVIFIGSPPDELFEKLQGNVKEMKARGALTLVVGTSSYKGLDGVDYFIDVGEATELQAPYALVPPLQLLAYKLAALLGHDPDKPRNLAKTVTVE